METLRISCFISGYQIECEKIPFLSVWVGRFTQSWFFFERQLIRDAQAHARTWCISTVVCHCKRQTTNEMEGFCEISFFIIPSVDFKSKKVPSARVPNASRIVVKILNKFKKPTIFKHFKSGLIGWLTSFYNSKGLQMFFSDKNIFSHDAYTFFLQHDDAILYNLSFTRLQISQKGAIYWKLDWYS